MLLSGLGKKFALVLVFVFAVSVVFLVEPSTAPVTMPSNPSPAPEIISVEINNTPYVASPIYTTDPYTGKEQLISEGYTRTNGTITITIKNRPFTPYTDKNGNQISIYHAVSIKNSETGTWERPWCVCINQDLNIQIYLIDMVQ